MKLTHLVTATAAVALLGGAAYAQDKNDIPKEPAPGAVTAPADTTAAESPPPADTGATTAADPNAAVNPPAAPATTDSTVASDVSATTPAASFTNMTVTNGPVPDTAENRQKYGQPMSRAGKRTAARGN